MPKVSFVMPTRNRGNLISETIKSIIDQTYSDWELIIVDDHSNSDDNTEDIVKKINDERIKYFRLEDENGIGIPCARNFGNAMASGQYVAIMDSDDVCYPDRIELSLNKIEEGFDLIYGEIDHWIPETGEVKKRDNQYFSREFDLNIYRKMNFIPHVTVMIRRDLSLIFPYNSFFRKAEDYDLLSRLAVSNCKFGFINKSLVKYRKHDGSISKDNNDKFSYDKIVAKNRGWLNYSLNPENK